jgi:DNA-binding Lrp family transcriptional regulator
MSTQKTTLERRSFILQRLRQQGNLSLEEIASELEVSAMTINRDVQRLAAEGSVKRAHGMINLPDVTRQETTCATCHAPITNRMQFLFTTATGANISYCCPHCGFAQLDRFSNAIGVFATDFLYGTMVNAYKVAFVIGSSLSLCCEPTVLSFKNLEEAEAFCRGFGGGVFTINEAIDLMYPGRRVAPKPA